MGNPSHVHSIMRTTVDISTQEGLQLVLQKIRGSLEDLVHHSEAKDMVQRGLLSSLSQLHEIYEQAITYLTHTCHERCQIQKMDESGENYWICKVSDNYVKSPTPEHHVIIDVPTVHSLEAVQILQRLGMMSTESTSSGEDVAPTMINNNLKRQIHIPKSSKRSSKFSPTNGYLFACYPSSQNLQFITGHTLNSYLVKYIAGLDEVAIVNIKPQTKDNLGVAIGSLESLKNTKIAGNKIKAKGKKDRIGNYGRALTQMEALTVIFRASLVTCTHEFILIPTSPREYRPAVFVKRIPVIKRKRVGKRVPDAVAVIAVTGQTCREKMNKFPSSRLFTKWQLIVIRDELMSPLSTDAITIFSIRPPELRFVNEPRLYLRWFERIHKVPNLDPAKCLAYLQSHLNKTLSKCEWLDGLNAKVVLRRGAIQEFLNYAVQKKERAMTRLLQNLYRLHGIYRQKPKELQQQRQNQNQNQHVDQEQEQRSIISYRGRDTTSQSRKKEYEELEERFLSKSSSTKLPTIWWTPIYPWNRGRFLTQILLLFGKFETEYELMATGDMKSAYEKAGIFDKSNVDKSINNLMTMYILDLLRKQPTTVYQFDRRLCDAKALFCDLLLDNRLLSAPDISFETPCVLQSKMVEETNKKVKEFGDNLFRTFTSTLYKDLKGCGFIDVLPKEDDVLLYNSDVDAKCRVDEKEFFPPPHIKEGRQGMESYIEQRNVMCHAKKGIDQFRGCSSVHENLVICGGPGNGKTTVAQLICLYAISKGLRGIATSIVADRSKQLGGSHIAKLCSLTSNEGRLSPGHAAEKALATMYRRPDLFHFWRTLDFLYIDEFGMLSAETLATIDIIAKHCKQSSKFLGGMYVLATIDILQLLPFRGTPVMLSMTMVTEFTFRELKESVRAASDRNLRELCNLARTATWTKRDETRFVQLLTDNCTFVDSFDSPLIPSDAVYVFGRKAPCRKVEELIIRNLVKSGTTTLITSQSHDEESTTAGNWNKASLLIQKLLSNKLKMKKELPLFAKGRYEFTHNHQDKFRQGQLALLLDVDSDRIRLKQPVEVYGAPAGCKEFPPSQFCTATYLESNGWKKVSVPYQTSRPNPLRGRILGRRSQYGLKLRVASTIHAAMGCTLSKIVTAVTNDPSSCGLDYTLWEAAQAVVLLSRTTQCKDMYFVGKPNAVAKALLNALKTNNRYVPHTRQMLSNLCNEAQQTVITVPSTAFRPRDFVLPKTSAVYLLVSTVDTSYMYIGETHDIRKRLNEHNSTRGSEMTKIRALQPWAVFGYVYKFQNRHDRLRFESNWKCRWKNPNFNEWASHPQRLLDLGTMMASEINETRNEKLRVQQCGSISLR